MLLRFIPVITCFGFFLFIAEYWSMVWMHHPWLIYALVDGWIISSLWLLQISCDKHLCTSVCVNICSLISLTPFLKYPWVRVPESQGKCVFDFKRTCHTVFHTFCTFLNSHQHGVENIFSYIETSQAQHLPHSELLWVENDECHISSNLRGHPF